MPTKRSPATKKTSAKKGARKAATKQIDPCTRACVEAFLTCLRRGGNKSRCQIKLIECLNNC